MMAKCAVVAIMILLVVMGHIYGAIAIILISSQIFKEVIQLKRKDEVLRNVLFSWVDWYCYGWTFYYLLPILFLRRDLIIPKTIDF
jgi:CDP-diglyceride synthetase